MSIKLNCVSDPNDYLEIGKAAHGYVYVEVHNPDIYADVESTIVNLSNDDVKKLHNMLGEYLRDIN